MFAVEALIAARRARAQFEMQAAQAGIANHQVTAQGRDLADVAKLDPAAKILVKDIVVHRPGGIAGRGPRGGKGLGQPGLVVPGLFDGRFRGLEAQFLGLPGDGHARFQRTGFHHLVTHNGGQQKQHEHQRQDQPALEPRRAKAPVRCASAASAHWPGAGATAGAGRLAKVHQAKEHRANAEHDHTTSQH